MTIIKRDIEIKMEPEELGIIFAKMDSHEQAIFFNAIAAYVKTRYKQPFVFQLQWVTDDELLTDAGRDIMEQIGNYSKCG